MQPISRVVLSPSMVQPSSSITRREALVLTAETHREEAVDRPVEAFFLVAILLPQIQPELPLQAELQLVEVMV